MEVESERPTELDPIIPLKYIGRRRISVPAPTPDDPSRTYSTFAVEVVYRDRVIRLAPIDDEAKMGFTAASGAVVMDERGQVYVRVRQSIADTAYVRGIVWLKGRWWEE